MERRAPRRAGTWIWGAVVLALAVGCHGAPIGGPNGCSEVQGSCKSSSSCLDYAGYDPTSLATIEQGCAEMPATWSSSPCDAHGSEGGCEIVAGDVCIVAWAFPPTVTMTAQSACINGALGNVWLAPPP
jgi:hypothetical protein